MTIENVCPKLTDPDKELRLIKYLLGDMREQDRVKRLTNQQLVHEILNALEFTGADILVEEGCTRLDPEWATREYPE